MLKIYDAREVVYKGVIKERNRVMGLLKGVVSRREKH